MNDLNRDKHTELLSRIYGYGAVDFLRQIMDDMDGEGIDTEDLNEEMNSLMDKIYADIISPIVKHYQNTGVIPEIEIKG